MDRLVLAKSFGFFLFVWVLLVGAAGSPASAASDDSETDPASRLSVTYLANEGFLLESGEARVLVDALFPGIEHYATLSDELQSKLVAARPPFSGIDLALATHFHADHFGADEVKRFLDASPATHFVSTNQAVASLEAVGIEAGLAQRIHAMVPNEGESRELHRQGITVEVFNLHHGRGRRPPVENLGFLIHLGQFSILHIGDTEAKLVDFEPYAFSGRDIDLALLPSWFVAEPRWRRVVERSLQPRALGVMHLAEAGAPASWFGSARSRERRIERILDLFPDAWVPRRALESRRYLLLPAAP